MFYFLGLKKSEDKYEDCKVCGVRVLDRKLTSHIEIHHLLPGIGVVKL